MRLILLGAPGAGKGTQADYVSEKFAIPTISTGNILRAAIKDGTPVGLKAKALVEAGQLVSDDIIMDILKERLAKDDCKNGFILDGVPRTIPQAEGLEKIGVEIDAALYLEVTDDGIVHRMTGRRTCLNCGATYHIVANPPKVENTCDRCGGELTQRKDDTPETVLDRLAVYHRETEPLLAFYAQRGKLFKVAGEMSLEDTTKNVMNVLENLK